MKFIKKFPNNATCQPLLSTELSWSVIFNINIFIKKNKVSLMGARLRAISKFQIFIYIHVLNGYSHIIGRPFS